jgi:hypothetical protein
VAEAEQNPIRVAARDLKVLVAFELLLQTLEGLRRAVIFEVEGDPGLASFPDPQPIRPRGLAGGVYEPNLRAYGVTQRR